MTFRPTRLRRCRSAVAGVVAALTLAGVPGAAGIALAQGQTAPPQGEVKSPQAKPAKTASPAQASDAGLKSRIDSLEEQLVDMQVLVGTLEQLLVHPHPWIQEYFHGPRARAALTP